MWGMIVLRETNMLSHWSRKVIRFLLSDVGEVFAACGLVAAF